MAAVSWGAPCVGAAVPTTAAVSAARGPSLGAAPAAVLLPPKQGFSARIFPSAHVGRMLWLKGEVAPWFRAGLSSQSDATLSPSRIKQEHIKVTFYS